MLPNRFVADRFHKASEHDATTVLLVSSREPYAHRRLKGRVICERTSSGLVSALDPVMRRLGGTWIACGSGKADREVVDSHMVVEVPPNAPLYRLRRVWLSGDEVQRGLGAYSRQVLWPVYHTTLDRVHYRKDYYHANRVVNARFADAITAELKERPGVVWIQDYQLSLLLGLIKSAMPDQPVCVFWHLPMPGPAVLQILPELPEILESLLASDTVMFQTNRFARAFLHCVEEFLEAEIDFSANIVEYRGHITRVCAYPVSVDFEGLSEKAGSPYVSRAIDVLRNLHVLDPTVRIGLGVDRLDYTEGILKRCWALDTFFRQYQEYRGRFTFIQITVPSDEDQDVARYYRELIRETVHEINARYEFVDGLGTPGAMRWRPIELREGRMSTDTLAAYYRMADIVLVGSVSDGMNLTAKEYVACQVDGAGVLLLSLMAGASTELTDALVINPYDAEGVADTFHRALEMPIEERRARMHRMRTYLEAHDIHAWANGCLKSIGLLPDTSLHTV